MRMRSSRGWLAGVVTGLLVIAIACKRDQNPSSPDGTDDGPEMIIAVLPDSLIEVGSRNAPLTVIAAVTKDATGEMAEFKATSGTFGTVGGESTTKATVDLNGVATVVWYPPDRPGIARITAAVDVVQEGVDIAVTTYPLVLDAQPATTIGVGLDNAPLALTATAMDTVADTALTSLAGSAATFTGSAGAFGSAGGARSLSVTLDAQGRARANWFPPDQPGNVAIRAAVGVVETELMLVVSPVTGLAINGLAGALPTDTTVLLEVTVDPTWAGSAVEVVAPQAILRATGPVVDGRDIGTRIMPILDAAGTTAVLLETPSGSVTITVTASLFGTIVTEVVVVN